MKNKKIDAKDFGGTWRETTIKTAAGVSIDAWIHPAGYRVLKLRSREKNGAMCWTYTLKRDGDVVRIGFCSSKDAMYWADDVIAGRDPFVWAQKRKEEQRRLDEKRNE